VGSINKQLCRVLAVMAGSLALSLGVVVSAHAHTRLVSSTPADGSTLRSSPEAVQLEFNEPLQIARVEIFGPNRTKVASSTKTKPGTTIAQQLSPALPPGVYTVDYLVISADGHPVAGQQDFTIATSSDTSPSPTPREAEPVPSTTPVETETAPPATAPAKPRESENQTGLLLVGGATALVILIAAGVAIAAWRSRRGIR